MFDKICWQDLLTKSVDKTWHGLGKNDIFLSNMRHGPEKLEIMLTNMTWSWQTGFWQTWYWHSLNLILKKNVLAVLDWFSILFLSENVYVFQTWISQATAGRNIKFKLEEKKEKNVHHNFFFITIHKKPNKS